MADYDILIAMVTNEGRILLDIYEPEDADRAIEEAKEHGGAHCYLVREGWSEMLRRSIGKQVKFGYHWRFE